MVVELKLNGKTLEPKLFTTLQRAFEVNEKLIFPLRYCDLALVSLIGITIYDMRRPLAESVVASTTIDLFDGKQRLRQGTINLQLWPGEAHVGLQSKTPGLHRGNKALVEINKVL
jgi:Phosphoinositide 3-kinase C2